MAVDARDPADFQRRAEALAADWLVRVRCPHMWTPPLIQLAHAVLEGRVRLADVSDLFARLDQLDRERKLRSTRSRVLQRWRSQTHASRGRQAMSLEEVLRRFRTLICR